MLGRWVDRLINHYFDRLKIKLWVAGLDLHCGKNYNKKIKIGTVGGVMAPI